MTDGVPQREASIHRAFTKNGRSPKRSTRLIRSEISSFYLKWLMNGSELTLALNCRRSSPLRKESRKEGDTFSRNMNRRSNSLISWKSIWLKWLRDHGRAATSLSESGPIAQKAMMMGPSTASLSTARPSFDYWIAESVRLSEGDKPDHHSSLFCASKAIGTATSDVEVALGRNVAGLAQFKPRQIR